MKNGNHYWIRRSEFSTLLLNHHDHRHNYRCVTSSTGQKIYLIPSSHVPPPIYNNLRTVPFFIIFVRFHAVKREQTFFQLCLFSISISNVRKREKETKREEEKLILLHVRPLGNPATYGGYSRVYSRISNTRALCAPGHDANLDAVVHERTAGVSLRQNGQTNIFSLSHGRNRFPVGEEKKEPGWIENGIESFGIDARFARTATKIARGDDGTRQTSNWRINASASLDS